MQNNVKVIKKCLFPVAGYGTRFLPVTKAIPKEMLPILTKPLIQYGVDEAISAGCDTIAMVTSKYKKAIEDHFDTYTDIESSIAGTTKVLLLKELNSMIMQCNFSYIRQKEMKGLGHAILTGEPLIGDEPFAVILADDLCYNEKDSVLSQMMEIYAQYPGHCIVAVEEIPPHDSHKYGVIDGDVMDKRVIYVKDMIEKPELEDAPSNLAIIGRYILNPEIFDVLRETNPGKDGEIQITDALSSLAKRGKVLAYQFQGRRFDCGSLDGFVEATNFFYQR